MSLEPPSDHYFRQEKFLCIITETLTLNKVKITFFLAILFLGIFGTNDFYAKRLKTTMLNSYVTMCKIYSIH